MAHLTVIPISEVIKSEGLQDTVNKYRLQIIHEDNNTYVIEDLKEKVSMVHGRIIHICKTQHDVIRYLKNLRCL